MVTCSNSKEKYQVWLLFCLTKVLDSLGLKLVFPSSPALYSYPGPADLGPKSSVLPARPRLGRELNFFCLLFVTIFVISNIKWPNALKVRLYNSRTVEDYSEESSLLSFLQNSGARTTVTVSTHNEVIQIQSVHTQHKRY